MIPGISGLLVKTKSSKFDPLVGVDTHCSKDKSSIIEINKVECLSEWLTDDVCQSIPDRFKSPHSKIGAVGGIVERED